jgi:hypothetical protein
MRYYFFLPAALLTLAGPVSAESAPDMANLFSSANAVDTSSLEEARGRFITADGLVVTLGLERLVSINGQVVERTELQLGDIGKLASGQGAIANEALGQLRLIQNGQVQGITPESTNLLGGTVIQNTLNDQLIKSETAINATVNTAGMLRALNFGTSLNNALSTALGPR